MSTVSCPRAMSHPWLYRSSSTSSCIGHVDGADIGRLELTHSTPQTAAAQVHRLDGGHQRQGDRQSMSGGAEIGQLRRIEGIRIDVQKWTGRARRRTRRVRELERRRLR